MEIFGYDNPFSEETELYSNKVDDAIIKKDIEMLRNLADEIELLIDGKENDISVAKLYYILGNIYAEFKDENGIYSEDVISKQLYYFRKSIYIIESKEYLDVELPYINGLKIRLYINYANILDICGRIVESLIQYKKALKINPSYGMAIGNMGVLYNRYALLEFDLGHSNIFHYFAYNLLKKAIICDDVYEEAKIIFSDIIDNYDDIYIKEFLEKKLNLEENEYSNSSEKAYRTWVIENSLFLNTMNDLPIVDLIFTDDFLHLPSMIMTIDSKSISHELFNQIKQEYIYSRYQYYLSLKNRDEVHYADKETYLINVPNYIQSQYSIRIESMKSAFKILYGLFDKIAYLINDYFKLGISSKDVNFKAVCGLNRNKKIKKSILDYNKNIMLQSLYWIAKDFFENDSPNPLLKRMNELRNALEHRHVKVIKDSVYFECTSYIENDKTLCITEKELSKLTLNLLHIIRESIICLLFSINIEENKKERKEIIPKIYQEKYDDNWKL